jgi:anaerobic ribonucleoside-triphosphate reductase
MMADTPTNPETTQSEADIKIPCEVYSRIVGYLRPVQNWHEGKQQEFTERKTFQVPDTGRQKGSSR